MIKILEIAKINTLLCFMIPVLVVCIGTISTVVYYGFTDFSLYSIVGVISSIVILVVYTIEAVLIILKNWKNYSSTSNSNSLSSKKSQNDGTSISDKNVEKNIKNYENDLDFDIDTKKRKIYYFEILVTLISVFWICLTVFSTTVQIVGIFILSLSEIFH